MTFIDTLLCMTLISFSAFLSGSEAALFSLSRFQLRSLKERFRPSYSQIKFLLNDPGGLLMTILVTNEIINISIATFITEAISKNWTVFPNWELQTLMGTLVTTPVILIFCEMTPKAISTRANTFIAPLAAPPLRWLYRCFVPIRFLIQWFSKKMVLILGKTDAGHFKEKEDPVLREEEFLSMVEEGHKEGAIHQTELDLIRKIFDLDDRTVIDVYTPLSQVFSLPSHIPIKTAAQTIQGSPYSRIPVTDSTKKKILGILYSKDLLFTKLDPELQNNTIESLMRKPLLVSPSVRLNALFRKFKQHRTHLAIVTIGGTLGEVMGIVTMADVLVPVFESVFNEDDSIGKK